MTTILLVEDEVLLREGVQETLEVYGYTVIGAGDGIEALDWLEQTPISMIITDLVMPKMNGVAFIEQVRIKHPNLPIIVASGSPDSVTSRLGIDTLSESDLLGEVTRFPLSVYMKKMEGGMFGKVFLEPDLDEKRMPL
jgi:CheY-like chemotaxis protein